MTFSCIDQIIEKSVAQCGPAKINDTLPFGLDRQIVDVRNADKVKVEI